MNGSSKKCLPVPEIDTIPDSSGVYLFIDSNGLILYVGKSIHLKKRVRQHLGKSGKRGSGRFSASAEKICYIETENELLALLMEDMLIKKHWPPFNKRQKKTKLHTFLIFSSDDFPYLHTSDISFAVSAYGPFKDSFYAGDMITRLSRNIGLRDCRKPLPGGECFRNGTGTCAAPCIGKISKEDYQLKIKAADLFLKSGEEDSLFEEMEENMKEQSASYQFERAAQIRDDLAFLRRYSEMQKFLRPFYSGTVALLNGDPAKELYIFEKGKLMICRPGLDSHNLSAAELIDKIYPEGEAIRDPGLDISFPMEFEPVRSEDLFDRGLIISSWLKKDNENRKFLIL